MARVGPIWGATGLKPNLNESAAYSGYIGGDELGTCPFYALLLLLLLLLLLSY